MNPSQSSSRGVLGPLGLLLVAVLWLMAVSGNIPSAGVATPTPPPQAGHVEKSDKNVIAIPGLAHNPATTHPTSVPSTGTGT